MTYIQSALCVSVLWLGGCAASNPSPVATPTVPTPPQITVASAVNALAQAVDGAVSSTIAARNAGKVSAADASAIEGFTVQISITGKAIDAELRSVDTWDVQRGKILTMVTGAGLTTLKAHISPGAQLFVSSLVALGNQISTAVGGPTI